MVPNTLQASVCDEQLMSIGVRLRCQETRRPTSDVEVATPFARDFNPSLALRFPSTIASKGSMIPSGSTIVHLPHFRQFLQFAEINP